MNARPAGIDDIPELVRLRQVMFDAMGWPASDWQDSCAEVLGLGLADGSIGAFVVDHPGGTGTVAGGVGTVAQRLPGPGNPTGRHGFVQSMATDPPHRRRGHARTVFLALLDWFDAQGVSAIALHTTAAGEPLYRSLGFGPGANPELVRRAEA